MIKFLEDIGKKCNILLKDMVCIFDSNALTVLLPKSSEDLLREIELKLESDKSHLQTQLEVTERYLCQLEALKESGK